MDRLEEIKLRDAEHQGLTLIVHEDRHWLLAEVGRLRAMFVTEKTKSIKRKRLIKKAFVELSGVAGAGDGNSPEEQCILKAFDLLQRALAGEE